jgi:hypothetical protein
MGGSGTPDAKTFSLRFCHSFSHVLTCTGGTHSSCTMWLIVFWLLMASKATWALNSALNFHRFRFMVL